MPSRLILAHATGRMIRVYTRGECAPTEHPHKAPTDKAHQDKAPPKGTRRAYVVIKDGTTDATIVYAKSHRNALTMANPLFGEIPAKQAIGRKAFRFTDEDDYADPYAIPADAPPADQLGAIMLASYADSGDSYYVYPLAAVEMDLSELEQVHPTREAWFQAFVEAARTVFGEGTLPPLPARVRVGCGFPSSGKRSKTLGECWHSTVTADGVREITIRPDAGHHELITMSPTLVHELLHAALPDDEGHGPVFQRCMPLVGLAGKATETVGGVDFLRIWGPVLRSCGAYPQAEFKAINTKPKQSTRMIKCWCANEDCDTFDPEREAGYICRTTGKWLEAYGAPKCPSCGEVMAC